MADIKQIAGELSYAMRTLVLYINVESGSENERLRWSTLNALRTRGLSEGRLVRARYREFLTPLGVAVRDQLRKDHPND